MQRKFVNNLLFVLLVNLLVKPFWILGIDRAVQNRVGAEDYGLYYTIFSFSILLNIILDFGITNYNNRNIAQHAHMLGRYFSGIFNLKLFLALLYLLVTLTLGLVINYDVEMLWLLVVLGINQVLASMILYLRSNIAGLHLFKTEGLLSVMDRLLMIVICGVLLWGGLTDKPFQIEWFVYAQFWAYLLTGFLAFLLVYNKARFYKLKIDFTLFRIILKESLPFALLVLLMSFYYRLDSVMIERLLPEGQKEVGVYAQAYRLLEGFNMFGYMFAGLLLPIFSRMIKQKESVSQLVNTSFNLIFIPSLAVVTISLMYPLDIMALLYDENIPEAAEIYAVLMVSFIAIALTYIYGTLLTANGSLKQLNYISLTGLLLNFGMNAWLIPKQGAYGAAIATLATQFFVILTQIIVSKRILQMKFEGAFILKQVLLITFGGGLAYLSRDYFSHFLYHSIFIALVFASFSIILGLISKNDILKVLKPGA
jgi:O-antigen/teichoic acid export membrane protein